MNKEFAETLIEMLEDLEWSGNDHIGKPYCIWCKTLKHQPHKNTIEHKPNCSFLKNINKLKNIIKEQKGE